jgi:hypothetical protein
MAGWGTYGQPGGVRLKRYVMLWDSMAVVEEVLLLLQRQSLGMEVL